MKVFENKPEPFFEILVHDVGKSPGLTGASAGYEFNQWRNEALADYLFDWLPEFALKYSDLEDFNSATGMRLIKKAAKTVYTTEKYQKRGEFGELLLHAMIRETFDSQPAISKIYYKSGTNDTVKGFDAVHIIEGDDGLELWLGEVKFYKDIRQAIRDVVSEINAHTDRDYLREEFILIDSKIDPSWEHSQPLKELISNRTSLDTVFKRFCLPVLLTYESDIVNRYKEVSEDFKSQLAKELHNIHEYFSRHDLPELRIHLFLVPLDNKEALTEILQRKLEGLQR